jgi:hypothetical protein
VRKGRFIRAGSMQVNQEESKSAMCSPRAIRNYVIRNDLLEKTRFQRK